MFQIFFDCVKFTLHPFHKVRKLLLSLFLHLHVGRFLIKVKKWLTYPFNELFVHVQKFADSLLVFVVAFNNDDAVLLTENALQDFQSVFLQILTDFLVLRYGDKLVSNATFYLFHEHGHLLVS